MQQRPIRPASKALGAALAASLAKARPSRPPVEVPKFEKLIASRNQPAVKVGANKPKMVQATLFHAPPNPTTPYILASPTFAVYLERTILVKGLAGKVVPPLEDIQREWFYIIHGRYPNNPADMASALERMAGPRPIVKVIAENPKVLTPKWSPPKRAGILPPRKVVSRIQPGPTPIPLPKPSNKPTRSQPIIKTKPSPLSGHEGERPPYMKPKPSLAARLEVKLAARVAPARQGPKVGPLKKGGK